MPSRFSFNQIFGSISKMISEEQVVEKKAGKSALQKVHDEEMQNAILVLAADVIRCNRNYTGDTEKLIQQFLIKHFGALGAKKRMEAILSHIEIGTEPFTRMACKELNLLATHDSKLNIVHFLFTVADADDYVNAKEIRAIQRIAGHLNIGLSDFVEIKQQFLRSNSPYFILGIEEGSSLEKVKTAYRKLVLKYHPDKQKGKLNEQEAGLKFREIQKAFETIKKAPKV